MNNKLRVLASAAVLSMSLAVAPVPAQAAIDPADAATALINIGSRIQSFYDRLAARLVDRRPKLAARLTEIGERVNARFVAAACAKDPDNLACVSDTLPPA